MKIKMGISLEEENLKNISGGAGASVSKSVSGVDNYPAEQKICPKCGSQKLTYKTFITNDGKGTKIGQVCECGAEWTFGNSVGVL